MPQIHQKTVANNKVLDEMSRSDPLTGISNRRGFLDTVKGIMEFILLLMTDSLTIRHNITGIKPHPAKFGNNTSMRKQSAIKKELERSLAKTVANNKVLDEMSRSDPLTGISNRSNPILQSLVITLPYFDRSSFEN